MVTRTFLSIFLLSSMSVRGMQELVSSAHVSDQEDGSVHTWSDDSACSVGERALLRLTHKKSFSEGMCEQADDAEVNLVRIQQFLPRESRVWATHATLKTFCDSLTTKTFNENKKKFVPTNRNFSHYRMKRGGVYNWDFSGTHWDGSVFSGVRMNGVRYVCASMKNCVISSEEPVTIAYSDFSNADLERVFFVSYAEIYGSVFAGANLKNAVIRDAVFKSSDLHGADFSDAQLHGVVFNGSYLRAACFKHARFFACSLGKRTQDIYANDVRGVDFTDAIFDAATLKNFAHALVNSETRWVDGKPMTPEEAALFGMEFMED